MLKNNNWMAKKLQPHIGHKLSCVWYGSELDIQDICIECEVLVSAEDFKEEDED